ncbi:MAG TPA: hypothetical protein VHV83_18810, partial [Armatimonadota bacterium]|nr:hypothetical protein [Armatimonadota bacterium]
MSTQVTVHMIGQAHIDPIWLWPWQSGLDEVLATCRTACDLLDEYDDFIFTRGEAWSYQQIELIDPELFARIHRHIDNGRWEIVGGWWIQPDCNLPSGFGFAQQIAIGLEYLRSRFGFSPEIGYNVDSFGHAATLPGYMHDAGQRFYVMMRPQEHEKRLPARLFRWRGYVDGPEVTTFRIAGAYTTGLFLPSMEHIQRSLTELPEGITHTMCFYGVGDHGGGPTEESIRWIREHRHDLDGCELVFSSPSRFFKAIEAQMSTLPVVTGELQHHAIGCYSVQRGIKTRVRKAEHLLHQAEMMLGAEQAHEQLQTAWEQVCFNHFHDILGGTSIPSAYPQAYNQLGFAASTADTVLQQGLRKKMNALPDAPLQRTVLCNASDSLYDGYTEFEPWTQWQAWPENGVLIGEDGNELPYQLLPQESATGTIPRLLTRVTIEPGAMQTIQLGTTATPKTVLPQVTVHNTTLANMDGLSLDLGTQQGLYFPGDIALPLPRLDLISDRSDNWSHGIDR